jgi:hypothetical protein
MHFDRTSDVVDDPRSAVRALWEGLRYLLLAQAIRPSDIHQLLVPDTPRVGTLALSWCGVASFPFNT